MTQGEAARILASIVRNVEMDGARAAVLRGRVPAPLSEVGEALRMAYNALSGDSEGVNGNVASDTGMAGAKAAE